MLCRGRIVWVELADPQGRNLKYRPAVVVTPTDDIRPDGDVWVVAISTQLDAAPAEVQVELPWQQPRHPRTGLNARSAAVSTWLSRVSVASIQSEVGNVPGPKLAQLLQLVGDLPIDPVPPANEAASSEDE